MLLIILSWVYIIFTIINIGFGLNKLIKQQNKDFVITSVLGLFAVTVLASFWAIFGRINIEFHYFLLTLNLLILLKFKKDIFSIYITFSNELKSLSKNLKYYLVIITLSIIAQCSSIPYIIDNESYYIQTIKWLNEYGFVKGLVNLHFFFGQMSGWHITQSVFNFSFIYKNFNDLSGFCLLLGNIFAIQKLNNYYKTENKNFLIVGLFPLFNLFLFQFISAPSPDIPVYVFTFIIIFYFLENFKNTSVEIFNLILIIVLYVLYIKNTAITLALIPLVLLAFNFKTLFKKLTKSIVIALLILGLFITKNMIICGSPIYPSKLFEISSIDYAIPYQVVSYYFDQLKLDGYYLTMEQYKVMTFWEVFLRWITLPKLNGLFNKISILLVLLSPFAIYRLFNTKKYWIVYLMMILQLLILFATSPQYRFFMNFILIFSIICLITLFYKKQIINFFLWASLILTTIVLFVPINLNHFSDNKFMLEISNFSTQNIVFPYQNSKYTTEFKFVKKGNLLYNSPKNIDFFWGCGNGNLPCVNKIQIDCFENYFHLIPQMRTANLKDGFYAKEIIPNE